MNGINCFVRVKIKPGDFFYVPSGTIHALGEGTLVLETQQSSDTTYRLYDYGRVGQDGKTRELHIDQSIAVATIPHKNADVQEAISKVPGAEITTFVEAEYFTVYKWELDGKATFAQEKPFVLVSVIDGEADMMVDMVDGKFYPIQKGDHFILPAEIEAIELDGRAKLIVSHV